MNIFREDFVIKNYLEESLDDILGQMDEDEDKDAFEFIERVKLAVDNKLKDINKNVDKLIKVYKDDFKSQWHYFAKFNNKEPYFGLARFAIERPSEFNKRKTDYILKKTRRLKSAKFFVDKWSGTSGDSIKKWGN